MFYVINQSITCKQTKHRTGTDLSKGLPGGLGPTFPTETTAGLVTTAVMEVATGARRMSGQDRLAMGPG